jgi:CRISPR-associated protein Csm1
MSYFSNEERFRYLKSKSKDISSLLEKEMTLISGDFWGIQKFIFYGLSTKNASKVLRAKSAFIQIFTEYITRYICDYFGVDEKYIISKSAGKFEILIPKKEIDIEPIQKSIDNYFKDNFYAINGIVLSTISSSNMKDKFLKEDSYKRLRDTTIPNQVEKDKFNKFKLLNHSYLLEYDTNINNQELCRVCNIRKIDKDEACKICNQFRELGQKLTKREVQHFRADFLDGFVVSIELNKKIKSYIPRQKDKYEALNFEEIAQNSCQGGDKGIKALAVLKADVDDMGKFLREHADITKKFENFDRFSQGLDAFFSEYIVDKLREKESKFRNIYTVFTGGDDLFLIGAWDEILEFSRFIRDEFRVYVNNKLTISFGIAIAKPTTPISYLADYTEHLLEDAKGIDGKKEVKNPKDAISLFKETVKWDEYKSINRQLERFYKIKDELNTSTLYSLLEIANMAIRFKYKRDDFKIRDALWKSKMRYLFNRNINSEYYDLIPLLDDSLKDYPKATKIFLSEFIYKRRKA